MTCEALLRSSYRDFRAQFGDTWYLVKTLLGHADVTTTMDVYQEPFRDLDVSLLIAHAHANIARTDRDIDVLHEQVHHLRAVIDDALAPRVRHAREQHEPTRLENLITRHHRRQAGTA